MRKLWKGPQTGFFGACLSGNSLMCSESFALGNGRVMPQRNGHRTPSNKNSANIWGAGQHVQLA
ncbi:hypothetical protein RPPS3_34120 [Rhodopseudomonas palustris]|nr:hypothetical protein RPPS3_34120 [Rhodopseudomonas palustris]